MKKFLLLFLCFILTACNNNEPSENTTEFSIIEIVDSSDNLSSNSSDNLSSTSNNQSTSIQISLKISSDILNNHDMSGGEIADVSLAVTENATVFEVLEAVCEHYGIELSYEGSAKRKTVYIKSLGGIEEKIIGDSSGWIFKVNGNSATKSCSAYVLNDGDSIEFLYTDGKGIM
jgi:hypothetical protein